MTTEWRSMTKAAFDAWHAAKKAELGYPLQGRNAKTGAIQPLSVGPTTDIAAPITVDATDVRVNLWTTEVVDDPKGAKDAQGKVVKVAAFVGKPSVAPTVKADGTVDVAKSKSDQVTKDAEG